MYSVDYMQFTIFKEVTSVYEVLTLIKDVLPDNVLIDLTVNSYDNLPGIHFYRDRLVFASGVIVLYNGRSGMGVNIILNSKTLKDTSTPFTNEVLTNFLSHLKRNYQYKFSRLDIALDTEKEFSWFLEKYRKKEFISKYRTFKTTLNDDDRGTIYFGKRGNLSFFRIYDKALEQKVEGIWTRIEMECRDDYCEQMLNCFLNNKVANVFLGHLNFVSEMKSNKSRCEEDDEYMSILMMPSSKMRLTATEKEDKTLEWIKNDVMPVLRAYEAVYGKSFVKHLKEEARISEKRVRKIIAYEEEVQNRRMFA